MRPVPTPFWRQRRSWWRRLLQLLPLMMMMMMMKLMVILQGGTSTSTTTPTTTTTTIITRHEPVFADAFTTTVTTISSASSFSVPIRHPVVFRSFHTTTTTDTLPQLPVLSSSSSSSSSSSTTESANPPERRQTRKKFPAFHFKKVMKIAFCASFIIDAVILLWGGRQGLSLLLQHHRGSDGNMETATTPQLLAGAMTTIWHTLQQSTCRTFASIRDSHWMTLTTTTTTALLLLFSLYSIYTTYRTQQRQRIDPTSEWERYAQYPLARTMAILQIVLFQMLPLSIRIIFYQQYHRRTKSSGKERYEAQITLWKEQMGLVFSQGLLQLGPLYIKMGQILSCRQNLLPPEWIPAMERLQDQVPALTGTKAQQLATTIWSSRYHRDDTNTNNTGSSLFNETFTNVDWTPIAAASLGQVHTATLRATNERVALKLQRPKLRIIYDNDLQLLQNIAALVDRFLGSSAGSVGGISQSWTSIFRDAQEILYREIDYRAEAQNAQRFARDFGLTKGGQAAATTATTATSRDGAALPSAASWLRTPYVYDDLSTEQVLVMEYVPSLKISNVHKLQQANVTRADREYLADCLGRSYLRQFCANQFFSTDPHAGNLGVELLNMQSNKPEERVRLVYYDFGQAAELQRNQADGILEIIEAIVDMDVDKSIVSFQKMGVLKDGADLDAVRAKVADNYRTGKVKANRQKLVQKNYRFNDVDTSGANFNTDTVTTTTNATTTDAQVMQYFTLPAEYAFVGRALSQMDGVGKTLDHDFDFVSSAAPFIVEIKGAKKYVQDEMKKRLSNICNTIRSMLKM